MIIVTSTLGNGWGNDKCRQIFETHKATGTGRGDMHQSDVRYMRKEYTPKENNDIQTLKQVRHKLHNGATKVGDSIGPWADMRQGSRMQRQFQTRQTDDKSSLFEWDIVQIK